MIEPQTSNTTLIVSLTAITRKLPARRAEHTSLAMVQPASDRL